MGIQEESDKQFGKGTMINASELLTEQKNIVSVSPLIDLALGGGISEGSLVIISGKPKLGKTTTGLQICSNAQKLDKHIYYYNTEGRLKIRDLTSIQGLDPNKNFKIVQSTAGHILSAEDFLNHASNIIKQHPGCVIFIDSCSTLCSRNELDNEISGQTRSLTPKIIASFCRKIGTTIPLQKTIVIITLHLIANTSGYGETYYEDGGVKIQYRADVRLRGKGFQLWAKPGDDHPVGQVIKWEVKSGDLVGATPGTKVDSYLRYGYGLDQYAEFFHIGLDLGLISKSGSWFTLYEQKIQGENQCIELLQENAELTKQLKSDIKVML